VQAQQISVKLYARDPAAVDVTGFIPIFHRWIQENRLPDRLLIDVADYRHVANGPGVVLIAHEAHYALDSEHGPLGLEVSQRRDPPGDLEEKLVGALRHALAACRHLEDDPTRPIRFHTDRVRVSILSRRLARADEETWHAARPVFEAIAARLYPGEPAPRLSAPLDPRAPFTVEIEAADSPALPSLLERLGG
jgi:hypothetical protein